MGGTGDCGAGCVGPAGTSSALWIAAGAGSEVPPSTGVGSAAPDPAGMRLRNGGSGALVAAGVPWGRSSHGPKTHEATSGTRRSHESRNRGTTGVRRPRSEEHTSELQSRQYLVCRLLL